MIKLTAAMIIIHCGGSISGCTIYTNCATGVTVLAAVLQPNSHSPGITGRFSITFPGTSTRSMGSRTSCTPEHLQRTQDTIHSRRR
ncbi:hypothetical protein PAXRUDRAFT_696146 [Paxillus rubicundulus Ve08.2h10]|uniref:Secreted protein n=1 Tax=Paxillus rubicundulus Ve08.2h10 TaxID=930991 RepID=A0A0D0CR59_9AGAM|nr:hypothetical protein PAXRUDRAFT_696146 [Paxillus rubicundulus Ve08.2h10]